MNNGQKGQLVVLGTLLLTLFGLAIVGFTTLFHH